ncbi:hypothetical protein ABZY10_29930 [Streptomyces sp. NPDC006539]|uniref:hypothetical protein n=1 Tax=Streptomyces sp. NPDC006539 TaxID=3155352 RepID=UPI0033A669FF
MRRALGVPDAGGAGPAPDPVVRNGAGLLLETLEEFSRGLDGSTAGSAGAGSAGRT